MSQHSGPRNIAKGSASAHERQMSAQIPSNMWIISKSTFFWCTKSWQLIGKNLCAMLGGVPRLPGMEPKETSTLKWRRDFWRCHSRAGKQQYEISGKDSSTWLSVVYKDCPQSLAAAHHQFLPCAEPVIQVGVCALPVGIRFLVFCPQVRMG